MPRREQEGSEILERMGSCIQSAQSQILRDRPELSYPADEGVQPEALLITNAIVRPGHQAAAEELIRKIAEAVPKTGDARRFTVYQPLVGNLRAIGSLRQLATLSELDNAQPLEDLLVQAFGASEGGLIYRSGSEAMESLEAELAVPRVDLSNPPQ